MAFLAAVGGGVDGMAEGSRSGTLDVEGDVLGLHSFMAAVTVGADGKGPFAVMAGSAGLSFFHLGHGHIIFFSGNDFSVVAASAGAAGFCDMGGVTECCFAETPDLVGHVTRIALVAFHTVFLGCDAECPHTAVAGAAALGLFHLGHGEVLAVPHVEDAPPPPSHQVAGLFFRGIRVLRGEWRRTQVVRERSAKPLCAGSNPAVASSRS